MRLIDAERIVYSWIIDKDGEEHDGITLQSIIDKMPTVDAEPVVRCKDCKYWEYDVIFPDGWCRGKHQGNPSWFCADGERREDADN